MFLRAVKQFFYSLETYLPRNLIQEKINNFGGAGFLNWDILPSHLTANLCSDWKSSYTQNGCRMYCGVLYAAYVTCRITRKGKYKYNQNGMTMRKKPHTTRQKEQNYSQRHICSPIDLCGDCIALVHKSDVCLKSSKIKVEGNSWWLIGKFKGKTPIIIRSICGRCTWKT